MLEEEQHDTQRSLLVLEHSVTVEGMQTGRGGPGLSVPQTHTQGDSFRKGLINTRRGRGAGKAEGGAEAKAEGVTWPLLLHSSSGHRPGSTVLQLVSSRPRCPLLRPLSQMGKQIPFHLPSSIFENKWTKETHT